MLNIFVTLNIFEMKSCYIAKIKGGFVVVWALFEDVEENVSLYEVLQRPERIRVSACNIKLMSCVGQVSVTIVYLG